MLEIVSYIFLISVFVAITAEVIIDFVGKKELYDRKDAVTSFIFGVLGVFTRFKTKALTLWLWFFIYDYSIFKMNTTLYSIIVLFFLNELIYYWFHRISHKNKFLWATHVNHHSSVKMNFAVGTRTPVLNNIYHILFWIPLPILGFNPYDILAVEIISFIPVYFQHTTIIGKLGFLEGIINTPSNHRVHHACNPKYIDKNFGNCLIIFDRIFGTYEPEIEQPIYGITKNPVDRGVLNMMIHGWVDWYEHHKAKN